MTKTDTADLSTNISKARAQLQSLETAQQEQQAREAESLRERQLEYLDGLTQEIVGHRVPLRMLAHMLDSD